MKIASDVTEVLEIYEGQTHVISFSNTSLCETFIESFLNYLNRKPIVDHHFAHFITDHYDTINAKNFKPIILNCGILNILSEKVIEDQVFKRFEDQIMYDEHTHMVFQKFEQSLNTFKYALEIKDPFYQIEIQDTSFKLKRLLKVFGLEFHHNLERLSEINKRKLFIDLLKDDDKENVLLILYPEAFLGLKDIQRFIQLIKSYQLTTIIITNHPSIIIEEENVYLCKSNKECHSIKDIREDLEILMPQETINDKTVRMIAYHEFIGTDLKELARYFEFINDYN
ncbi:hypothetical protein [Staphylococcus felis]|uniref:hypothetical protein n=1 Tax=Staphylococcus felis TaxID=46127 RepID=UPI000E28B45F|nr:hypothetical protein [Staphylococcus felis]REI17907.1 hypothetical protein DOS73_00760 [Staphylococcus felis]